MIITDFISQTKTIAKQLILNFNYIFSSPLKLCLFSLIISLSLVLPIIFVPLKFGLGLVVFIGAIIPSSIIFISVDFNFHSSTLSKNQSLNKNKGINHYISSLLTFYISTYIIVAIVFISLVILQELNLLLYSWRHLQNDDERYILLKINYLAFFYSVFELSTTTYFTLSLISIITKREKVMYVWLLTLLILVIIYGGVFNNYFPKARDAVVEYAPSNGYKIPYYNANAALEWLFYPCLMIFPFFAPLQHLAWFKWSICSSWKNYNVHFFIWEHSNWYINETFNLFSSAMHWNALWMMPYAHSFVAIALIFFNKSKSRNTF